MTDLTDAGCRPRIVSRTSEWSRQRPLHAFGGRPLLEAPLPTSARCGRPFHLAFDFDLADPRLRGLGISSVQRLAVLACYHVDYQPGRPLLVRHHDGGRRLEILREPPGKTVERVIEELPQLPVELDPLNEAEAAVEFADELPDGAPPLHRIGGHPIWLRDPLTPPACPVTGAAMRFIGMLDSIRRFPLADAETSLLIGDGGVAYIFWSDEAAVSAAVVSRR